MTDTPNFYFFNKKKSSVTAFILDLSINGNFEAWKILVAEKEIILAQEYRLFLIRLPIYMGKMALTQKSAIIGRFSRMSNSCRQRLENGETSPWFLHHTFKLNPTQPSHVITLSACINMHKSRGKIFDSSLLTQDNVYLFSSSLADI